MAVVAVVVVVVVKPISSRLARAIVLMGLRPVDLCLAAAALIFALVSVFQWPVFVVCCQCALSDHQPITRFFILKTATLLQLLVVLSNILSYLLPCVILQRCFSPLRSVSGNMPPSTPALVAPAAMATEELNPLRLVTDLSWC